MKLIVRICRSCGAAGSQKPNGSYKCLKCDSSVSYQEFIALVRADVVSNDLLLKPGTFCRPLLSQTDNATIPLVATNRCEEEGDKVNTKMIETVEASPAEPKAKEYSLTYLKEEINKIVWMCAADRTTLKQAEDLSIEILKLFIQNRDAYGDKSHD